MGHKTYSTEFGATVSDLLIGRRMNQSELAAATARSPQYTNMVLTGRKPPSMEWAKLVADNLQLSPQERERLFKAAARDTLRNRGYSGLCLDLGKL